MECLIPHKHTLKILYKLKRFPPRYKRKCESVFFSEHSVQYQCTVNCINCRLTLQLFDVMQKCVTALDKAWHPEHFLCMMCGLQLGDENGFHEHDGRPYCE